MEGEDLRSRSINLLFINQDRIEEILILDKFQKKLEKKIKKINNDIGKLKELSDQLKDIKKEVSPFIKKWKEKLLDYAEPFDMTEGNMLYIALYFVFIMRLPSSVSSYMRNYLMNLMLEWDIKYSMESAIFSNVNMNGKNFDEECALYGIESCKSIHENLALIKLIKKFKLPFPFIYDPLGIAYKYITLMEAENSVEMEMMTSVDFEDLDADLVNDKNNNVF